jgi:hypothetical protein
MEIPAETARRSRYRDGGALMQAAFPTAAATAGLESAMQLTKNNF